MDTLPAGAVRSHTVQIRSASASDKNGSAAGGYEFVRDIASKFKIGDGGGDGVIIQFLACR